MANSDEPTQTTPKRLQRILSWTLFVLPFVTWGVVWLWMMGSRDENFGIFGIVLNPIVAPVLAAALVTLPCLAITLFRVVFLPHQVLWIDCVAFVYQSALWVLVLYYAFQI